MNIQKLDGKELGQYRLEKRIGMGGMGAVYLATQLRLNRTVAVKVLARELSNRADFVERFNREATTVAALEHPSIVPVYDYGESEGIVFVVMRLLTGGALSGLLEDLNKRETHMSLPDVAALLNRMAGALDYAHGKNVIHRDIKPSNVMFDNADNPFLVDFGIAKVLGSSSMSITQTGMVIGTPSHMSPEQWQGEEIGPAADQYSTAIVIYQCLTGALPFEATAPMAMMFKHVNEPPTPPQMHRTDLPPGVQHVLEHALNKQPKDRFPTMKAFAEAFANAVAAGIDLDADDDRMSGIMTNVDADFGAMTNVDPLFGIGAKTTIGSDPPSQNFDPMGAATMRPGTGPQYPGTGQYQPGTGQYNPGTGQYNPGTGQYNPATGQYNPGTGQFPPGTGQFPPGTGTYPQGQRASNNRNVLLAAVLLLIILLLVGGGVVASGILSGDGDNGASNGSALSGLSAADETATFAAAVEGASTSLALTTEAQAAAMTAEVATEVAAQADDVSPTPTATETEAETLTPTPDPTDTPAPTDTRTPTATDTATPTATPTITATATVAATDTSTPRPTNTPTPTITQTPTLDATATPTRTASPTVTVTRTPSPTITLTPTVASLAVLEGVSISGSRVTLYTAPDDESERLFAATAATGFEPLVGARDRTGDWLYVFYVEDGGWRDAWALRADLNIAFSDFQDLLIISPADAPGPNADLPYNPAAERP